MSKSDISRNRHKKRGGFDVIEIVLSLVRDGRLVRKKREAQRELGRFACGAELRLGEEKEFRAFRGEDTLREAYDGIEFAPLSFCSRGMGGY